MLRLVRLLALTLWVSAFAGFPGALAQTGVPEDFRLTVESRPTHLYDDIDIMRVVVEPDGTARIKAFRYAGEGGDIRGALTVSLSDAQQVRLWQLVQDADFFNQPEEIINYRISGGDVAIFTVRANGREHSVSATNMPVPAIDAIAGQLNRDLPPSHRLYYNALFYPDMLLDEGG